jgi:hypothetical protein
MVITKLGDDQSKECVDFQLSSHDHPETETYDT